MPNILIAVHCNRGILNVHIMSYYLTKHTVLLVDKTPYFRSEVYWVIVFTADKGQPIYIIICNANLQRIRVI